jgi:hypothetical protein
VEALKRGNVKVWEPALSEAKGESMIHPKIGDVGETGEAKI